MNKRAVFSNSSTDFKFRRLGHGWWPTQDCVVLTISSPRGRIAVPIHVARPTKCWGGSTSGSTFATPCTRSSTLLSWKRWDPPTVFSSCYFCSFFWHSADPVMACIYIFTSGRLFIMASLSLFALLPSGFAWRHILSSSWSENGDLARLQYS